MASLMTFLGTRPPSPRFPNRLHIFSPLYENFTFAYDQHGHDDDLSFSSARSRSVGDNFVTGNEESTTVEEENTPLWSLLPDDLVDRILFFLPLRSLERFKCLSRQWHPRRTTTVATCLRESWLVFQAKINRNFEKSQCHTKSTNSKSKLSTLTLIPLSSSDVDRHDGVHMRKKKKNTKGMMKQPKDIWKKLRFGRKLLIARFLATERRSKKKRELLKNKRGKLFIEEAKCILVFDFGSHTWMKPMRLPPELLYRDNSRPMCTTRNLILDCEDHHGHLDPSQLVLYDLVTSSRHILYRPAYNCAELIEAFGMHTKFDRGYHNSDIYTFQREIVVVVANDECTHYVLKVFTWSSRNTDPRWEMYLTRIAKSFTVVSAPNLAYSHGAYFCILRDSSENLFLSKIIVDGEHKWDLLKLEIEGDADKYSRFTVLACNDTVILVRAVYPTTAMETEGITIWQMQSDYSFQKLTDMDPRWLPYIEGLQQCLGRGERIFFMVRNMRCFLYYDIADSEWKESPSCPHDLLSLFFCWTPV